MIVDPDFLSHWRTTMLIDELGGDEMAPLYVLRLWAHCQVRRSDTFEMPAAGLKALCRYRGNAATFESAMVSAGFLERQGTYLIVRKWDENSPLFATKRLNFSEWSSIRDVVFERDGMACVYCGASGFDVSLECDHIVPVSKGGSNDIENLATSCFRCNRSKGSKSVDEWRTA